MTLIKQKQFLINFITNVSRGPILFGARTKLLRRYFVGRESRYFFISPYGGVNLISFVFSLTISRSFFSVSKFFRPTIAGIVLSITVISHFQPYDGILSPTTVSPAIYANKPSEISSHFCKTTVCASSGVCACISFPINGLSSCTHLGFSFFSFASSEFDWKNFTGGPLMYPSPGITFAGIFVKSSTTALKGFE